MNEEFVQLKETWIRCQTSRDIKTLENISRSSGQSFSWVHLIIGRRLTKDQHVQSFPFSFYLFIFPSLSFYLFLYLFYFLLSLSIYSLCSFRCVPFSFYLFSYFFVLSMCSFLLIRSFYSFLSFSFSNVFFLFLSSIFLFFRNFQCLFPFYLTCINLSLSYFPIISCFFSLNQVGFNYYPFLSNIFHLFWFIYFTLFYFILCCFSRFNRIFLLLTCVVGTTLFTSVHGSCSLNLCFFG